MNLKKKMMVIIAAGIMVLSAVPLAFAATPAPADNAQEQVETTQQSAPAAQTMEFTNSKYLTKGGAAFWFIFITLLNGALSFWVGNRFYRMSKKDNHLSSEVRALRRDVEEKFAQNIGGFAEQEVDIENTNESLAMNDEGIKPVERHVVMRDATPEEEERFRRWAQAQSKPKSERIRPKSALREELNEEFDDVKKIRKKNYQPKREIKEASDENGFDKNEDLGETRVISAKGNAVKNKTKEILNDIFPFKED